MICLLYTSKLLRELCKISGLRWIRILYCYPEEITDELIQVIKEEDKICNYLDLPIQHASDGILKRMGRRTSKKQLIEIVEKLRKEIPDIAIPVSYTHLDVDIRIIERRIGRNR